MTLGQPPFRDLVGFPVAVPVIKVGEGAPNFGKVAVKVGNLSGFAALHVVLPVGAHYLADVQTGCKEKRKDLVSMPTEAADMTTAKTWLKATRAQRDETQHDAAKRCGVSLHTFHRWEAHNLIPTLAQAVEIARWADVTVDEVAERFGFDLGGEAEVRP